MQANTVLISIILIFWLTTFFSNLSLAKVEATNDDLQAKRLQLNQGKR